MDEKLLDGDGTDNLETLYEVRLTALLHDQLKEASWRLLNSLGSTTRTLAAVLDSGVLTPRLFDALEKAPLALDDLRTLVDRREDRRKWDLKGVPQGVSYRALPEEGPL